MFVEDLNSLSKCPRAFDNYTTSTVNGCIRRVSTKTPLELVYIFIKLVHACVQQEYRYLNLNFGNETYVEIFLAFLTVLCVCSKTLILFSSTFVVFL